MSETTTETKLLDLNSPERVARVSFAGKEARHFFRPIALADWVNYFKTLATEFISAGDELTPEARPEEAAAQLWEKCIVRVEGYRGQEWRARTPVSHKMAAVAALQEVYAMDGGDPFDLEADAVTVRLEAAWNGEVYSQLKHRFRLPSSAETLSYRRLNVSFLRSKGRRNPETRIRAAVRLAELCRLYDSLILETSGYAGDLANLDALHKMGAVSALFEPPEPEVEEAA